MKYLSLIFIGFNLSNINPVYSENNFSNLDTNAIIKSFCIENVKAEISKTNFKYDKNFGNKVCNCYLENIQKNIGHNESINKCKFESKEDLNLN